MLIFRTEDTWNRFSRYSNRLDKSRFNLSVNEERTQKEKKECDYHWLLVIHAASNKNDRGDLDCKTVGFSSQNRFLKMRGIGVRSQVILHSYSDHPSFLFSLQTFRLTAWVLLLGKNSGSNRGIFCRHIVLSPGVKLSEILSYLVWYRHKYYGIWNLYFKTRLKWFLSPVESETILSVTDLRAK